MKSIKIEEGIFLNTTNGSSDPFDYHLEKCGVDSFNRLERSLIHTFWPGHGEDMEIEDDFSDVEDEVEGDGDLIETSYTNGNNEVGKIFNQKRVICLERDSDYAFKQCGHQFICEQCYRNRGDIDILKCVVCRTKKKKNNYFKYLFRFFFVNFTRVLGKNFVEISKFIFPFKISSLNCATCFSSPCFSI